jgi:putative hemolysin
MEGRPNMAMWEEYLSRVRGELEQLRLDLAPLVSGEMRLGSRTGDGPWEDVTQERIDHINRTIATYESIAEALLKREIP